MKTLISYNNDPKIKSGLLREIKKHREADMIEQGHYGNGKENGRWKGCAVACSVRSLAILNGEELKTEYNDHARFEEIGIPECLVRLQDTIFEGLLKEDAQKWPEQFLKAIPVGVNLEPVKWHFSVYLIEENIKRVRGLKHLDESVRKKVIEASEKVLKVHKDAIKTGKWDTQAASAARSVAESVARSAAESARSAYKKHAKKLLSLLKQAHETPNY